MSVKLWISEGSKKVELEIAKANNLQVINIIHGLFGLFGVTIPNASLPQPVKTQIMAPTVKIEKQPAEKPKQEPEKEQAADRPKGSDQPEKPAHATKQLPYVNGDRTLTTSIGEKLGQLLGINMPESDTREGTMWVDGRANPIIQLDKQVTIQPGVTSIVDDPLSVPQEQKEYKSIREVDGRPAYQTYVYCKNVQCGKRTKVFVKERQLSVYCPACNTKHIRRDATKDGFPNQDDFGNFFKADSLWVENFKNHDERIKSPVK